MSNYTEKAQALRDDPAVHYNCAQAVLMSFAEKAGLSEEAAANISANFGSGMKRGSVCGAVTGGLMVLGLFGVTDVSGYYARIKAAMGEDVNCAALLKSAAENGLAKKPYCDGLISAAVTAVESVLEEQEKL